tara:strand:+ start:25377 stop:26702 length:1326 start_codon:yes stop_codon:yes gene_type:complete
LDDGALGKALTGITQIAFGIRQSAFYGQYEGSSAIDGGGDVDSTMAEFRLRYYFSDRLSAGFSLPTGFLRFDPGGTAAVQRASGFGDIELQGRYLLKRGVGYGLTIDIEGALSLPTGESSLSEAQAGATAPPNILSLGRGAFGVRTQLGLSKFLTRSIALRGWLGAASPLSANANNITFGQLFTGGIGASYLLGQSWTLAPQLSTSFMTHSNSTVNGELINSGGVWLNAEFIASWRASDDFSISATARLPAYRNVNGQQTTESVTGLVQLAYRFGGEDEEEEEEEEEEEHDHGDGDAHDHGEGDAHEGHGDAHEGHDDAHEGHGDVQDAARDGATFDAVGVAVLGKVTVVDFWAEWCGPCKPLTRGLERLAAANPGIALRKVEVPSFDTAVAKEHLANAKGLPMVWIYDTAGKRVKVLEQKKIDEVSKAVEAELAKAEHKH